jgi:hypothetical protein
MSAPTLVRVVSSRTRRTVSTAPSAASSALRRARSLATSSAWLTTLPAVPSPSAAARDLVPGAVRADLVSVAQRKAHVACGPQPTEAATVLVRDTPRDIQAGLVEPGPERRVDGGRLDAHRDDPDVGHREQLVQRDQDVAQVGPVLGAAPPPVLVDQEGVAPGQVREMPRDAALARGFDVTQRGTGPGRRAGSSRPQVEHRVNGG